jgi:hypothetical protein
VRLLKRTFLLVGMPALCATVLLTSCEDDPILAPQSGGKKSNGSYGNVALAPPIDSAASPAERPANLPVNPEVY